MKTNIILSLIAILVLSSCSPAMQQIWTKDNFEGSKFKKILVIGIAQDIEAGTTFENVVVETLKKKGFDATNSLTVFSSDLANEELSEEQIQLNIEKGNYDGVLVSFLADSQTRKVSITGPDGYYSSVGKYSSYINDGSNFTYTGESYREEKSFVLETKLFDNNASNPKEALVWSGQSSITEPSSFYAASKDYAQTLVKTLIQSNIFK